MQCNIHTQDIQARNEFQFRPLYKMDIAYFLMGLWIVYVDLFQSLVCVS